MSYADDTMNSIADWDESVVVTRRATTYTDTGEPSTTFTTIATALCDIQPISTYMASLEVGEKIKTTHFLYGYYNILGVVLDIQPNDVVTDSSSNVYEVKGVQIFENSHIKANLVYVKGKANG